MASGTITKILKLKDEASPELRKLSGEADKTAKKVDNLGDEAKETGEQLKGMGGKAKQAGDKTKQAGDKAKDTGDALKGMAMKGAAAGLAILGAVKALIALNQRLADSKNELIDTGVKTGLTAETIGGLRLAAKGSGQELGALASGLTQFPKRMADASRGTGEALIAFKELGIEVNDTSGKMRSADDVLRETVAAINEVPDATQRSALATQAFGRAGTNLMVALSGEDLQKFIVLAKEFGVSVGPEAAAAAARWQREMALWDTTMDGSLEKLAVAVTGTKDMGEATQGATTALIFFTEIWAGAAAALREAVAGPFEFAIEAMRAWANLIQGDFSDAADHMKSSLGGLGDAWRLVSGTGPALMGNIIPSLVDATKEALGFKDTIEGLDGLNPKIKVDVSVEGDFGTSIAGLGNVDTVTKPKTGKSKATQQLEALTKQVERMVSKAFPTTKIQRSAKLLDDLSAARDKARRSRKQDYTDLIADAQRARKGLQAIDAAKAAEKVKKAAEKITKEMGRLIQESAKIVKPAAAEIEAFKDELAEAGVTASTSKFETLTAQLEKLKDASTQGALQATSLKGAIDAVTKARAEEEQRLRAEAPGLYEQIRAGFEMALSGMSDVGGMISGLGPEAAIGASLSDIGNQATATQDATLSELEKAREDRKTLRAEGADPKALQANRELIETLEAQAEQGGFATMVEANVRGFVEGFKVFIEELPAVVGMLAELIPQLVASLIESAPVFIKALLLDLPLALVKGFVKGWGKVWDKIVAFFTQSFDKILSALSGGIFDEEGDFSGKEAGKAAGGAATGAAIGFAVGGPPGAAIGAALGFLGGMAFQTGGVVDRTGMALVHANERILPSSGAVPQSARGMLAAGNGGGPEIHIHTAILDPNVVDQLGRQLQRHFGRMGSATLPIFGGG